MKKVQEFMREDGEANFETLEEALFHLRAAYSDLLGLYAAESYKGIELIKKVNTLVKEECNYVVEQFLGKDYVGEDNE